MKNKNKQRHGGWADKVGEKELSGRMSALVSKRWASKTVKEKRAWGLKLVEARKKKTAK